MIKKLNLLSQITVHDIKYGNPQNQLLAKDFMWREVSDHR